MEKQPIPVLLAGLPGNMACLVAARIDADARYDVIPYSFTGEGQGNICILPSGTTNGFRLFEPEARDLTITTHIKPRWPNCIVIDFTQPSAANDNCEFYCKHNLPFVMGTTGGDRDLLVETVNKSNISAVIAPNMSIPVVMMMDMIAHAANNYPDALAGWDVRVVESHQAVKKDKSGTAIDIGKKFLSKLGINFTEDKIRAIRDPFEQGIIGVPPHALNGHGFHRYYLGSPDGNVQLGFEHNVSGRETYVDGTLRAVDFLAKQIDAGVKGKCFNMIDVMRG